MKRLVIATMLTLVAPLALAEPTDNEFCNGKAQEAEKAYLTGADIDKQPPIIEGFIRIMRDGRAPDQQGGLMVISFTKGFCLGFLTGAKVGEQAGIKEERKKNTF